MCLTEDIVLNPCTNIYPELPYHPYS